ncbi:MAG: hypothetical protein Q8R78_04740 [Candidatus Omnitrophota bacterium]|nr:hypothetical protein [Candidatus Omnitrophota bacterium]
MNAWSKTRVAGQEHGFIIIFSMGIIVFLTILGSAFLMRSVHDGHMSEQSVAWNRALALAEASVDETMMKQHVGDFTNLATVAMSDGTYWADVSPTGAPWQYLVNGHGMQQAVQRDLEVITQLTPTSIFQFALFGHQRVYLDGDVITDSYDSRLAPYDPNTAGQNGDIGTNSSTVGGVVVDGDSIINGQIAVGPNVSDPTTVVTINGTSAVITGSPPLVSQSVAMPMPAVVIPAWLTCTDLTVNANQTYVLSAAAGPYCFNNLVVLGGAELTTDGPVKVYVTNYFHATGNTTIGVPGNPSYLTMLLTAASQATIDGSMGGTTEFYGGLYAPNADIDIGGNAEVYGSVIAQEVVTSGTPHIHYDESLGDLMDPIGLYKVKVLSWRELK